MLYSQAVSKTGYLFYNSAALATWRLERKQIQFRINISFHIHIKCLFTSLNTNSNFKQIFLCKQQESYENFSLILLIAGAMCSVHAFINIWISTFLYFGKESKKIKKKIN